jgi:signal transduction histidine kinase
MEALNVQRMSSQSLIEKFIYSCSHDLRAPVSSIQGLVRIAEYYPHHDEIHQCLEMIEACTHEMDKRISKLQEYMVNNLRPLRTEKFSALDLIQEIRTEFKNQLGASNIELISDAEPSTMCSTDKHGTLTILKYLISNSIAFHDPEKKEKKITVKVESNEHGCVFEVKDNGKGIPEDQQPRVFDVFFRGTEKSIGLGMGLFLAQSMAENLGASISCQSEIKVGTSMRVSLPNRVL